MTIALFAGSFDPITNAHMALLKSACQIFEQVYIGFGIHHEKKGFLSPEERKELIIAAAREYNLNNFNEQNIVQFDGLLIDACKDVRATTIIRGLRTASDFDYEIGMSDMNRAMAEDIETIFLTVPAPYRGISSSLVRQIAKMGGDFSSFVPSCVAQKLNSM